MKKSLFLFAVLFIATNAQNLLEFKDYKINGALDSNFIKQLVEIFNVDTFFETGTYLAQTTYNTIPYFKTIVSVELHDELFTIASKKLAPHNNVQCYHGKSPEVIKKVAPTIEGSILFWLDAHYSGEGTAISGNNQEVPEAITAIREELKAIEEAQISDCVILIDDIRGFGTEINGQLFLGCWAYPTLQEVQQQLLRINPNFELALLGDMLLAYDKDQAHPQFSNTVKACTKTRLFDGSNLCDQELHELEETIKNAPIHEKNFIKSLYERMTNCNDPMFWHDLWYGLISLGLKDYSEALNAFIKVKIRVQHLNQHKQKERKLFVMSMYV